MASTEKLRLQETREQDIPWKKWGPYLSERQWGTVREDYSDDGNAWNYFSHEQARSRAYHWGEDGLAGISDDKQLLCFALALWNGKDKILKERLFGLTNSEGNHGEDVKEYYFYLDSTPTHSYMKYLYKYPQGEFPYVDLVKTNQGRSQKEPEYELLDTEIFDEDKYFDIFVEYAKAEAEDLLIQISICNRGPEAASLRVLPTLWFRNTWSWTEDVTTRPMLAGAENVRAIHPELGEYRLYCEGTPQLLFTENETNNEKLFSSANAYPYLKDGINDYVVSGKENVLNPDKVGTKVAADYNLTVAAGETKIVRLRLTQTLFGPDENAFDENFEQQFQARKKEADEFYHELIPESLSEDEGRVMRQALAGMMWTKQYYEYDVKTWLKEHTQEGISFRNSAWTHMVNHDVISMPDKWEYPWYATWDLAFHTIALVLVDNDFAKQQLLLFLEDRYLHPNGQLPAYEWNFSDVNPPVHPFAVLTVYLIEKENRGGEGDIDFLKRAFNKLIFNFNWWINKKD
ncbi:MAG: glucosidase, partial [Prochloraceae cyanobacterium]